MTDPPTRPVIADRYEVVGTLGRGSFGHTFLARDRETDRQVAMKMLDARNAPDWKAFELFEREVSVLGGLRHPGVPEVFDSFRADWDDREAAFLVMEYVEGISVEEMIETGEPADLGDVTRLLLDLLGILEYLHGRVPPVLHRDIKPANIIVRPNGVPALVDFGAVRNAFAAADDDGSTVVGTFGYMPYEQYMGHASPSSDLYALAATVLHLMTRRPVRDFMSEGGRIEVPDELPDPRLRGVLQRMLRPSPAERFSSARMARDALILGPGLVGSNTAVAATRAAPLAQPTSPLPDFGPAPRNVEGRVREAYDRVAWSAWRFWDTAAKHDGPTVRGVFMSLSLGACTFGILPLWALVKAAQRRRKLRRFFREGTPTEATILDIQIVSNEVEQKVARVTYEFVADGRLHRAADRMPQSAEIRLRPGETIHVLQLGAPDYDSVIITP